MAYIFDFWVFGGGGGEAELILRIWGAKKKYYQGAEEFSFMELGTSMYYFQDQGSTDPPPLGGLTIIQNVHIGLCMRNKT